MASDVGIINGALTKLGQAAILSLSDDSRQARLATRTYTDIRDDLLRDHPWNWAMKRTSLSASSTSPEWGYDNAFVLPATYLRLIAVNDAADQGYSIESTTDGPVIATDIAAPLEVMFVARITDPNEMDSKFREALSARCAAEWAEPLTGDSGLRRDAVVLAEKKLREARTIDGQEDSIKEIAVNTWIDARY